MIRQSISSASLLLLAVLMTGCSDRGQPDEIMQKVNGKILNGQVALIQAANNARSNIEADLTADAESAVQQAQNAAGLNEEGSDQNQGFDGLDLSNRYAVRQTARGYSVIDTVTGRTASYGTGRAAGLDQDAADYVARKLSAQAEGATKGPLDLGPR